MPRRIPKSVFDLPDVNPPGDSTQSDPSEDIDRATDQTTDDKAPHYSPYYDASDPSSPFHPTRDTDSSSIFTQGTVDHPTFDPQPNQKRRFSFLNRTKSSTTGEESKGLLAEQTQQAKSNKAGKFSIFSNKPYEPTEKDLEVAQRIRERLGSREEAVRRGAAQPAGIKGPHGAYLGGAPV